MVCDGCMSSHQFLESYRLPPLVTVRGEKEREGEEKREKKEEEKVDVVEGASEGSVYV